MKINLYDCLFVHVITTGNLKRKFKYEKKNSHLIIKIMIILNEMNCFTFILIDSEKYVIYG